ncbi:DUF4362 domain-containing protein [Bacillus gaemokensis]|uniref:DUF4362 domain-containing protein n=1 Tax=Bacillus gaemokensis TaxID=574375 RepID=A0A073KFK8_9BACI|nr:DUF4362 domain-containing protein [Bacillus gaemokensis]KEK25365.1 hypothetical protein BAGA_12120 [Bacillus gaemokensis]KYG37191.1 hypothetical protein AZF08_07215 [Bacillus gaemokensis]
MTIRTRIGFTCLFVCIVSLVACSQSSSKIDKNNDVIAKGYKISNLHKFEKFALNVGNGEADKIRIVHYTDEGDPIFQTLEYDGKEVRYTSDDSHDKFAGTGKGIYSDTCKKITKDIHEEDERYMLTDCKKETGRNGYDLLSVPVK